MEGCSDRILTAIREIRIAGVDVRAARVRWDEAKAASNEAKHDVSFRVARAVFDDERRVDINASRDEDREVRRKVIGVIGNRLYAVVYTIRGSAYRIISARVANPPEKRLYGHRSLHL